MKCMAAITASGRMEAREHGMVLFCSLDPGREHISWLGKKWFLKITEVRGESKSSEKKHSKEGSAKTVWNAVYPMRDVLRTQNEIPSLSGWGAVKKSRKVHHKAFQARGCLCDCCNSRPYSVTSLMQLAEWWLFPVQKDKGGRCKLQRC